VAENLHGLAFRLGLLAAAPCGRALGGADGKLVHLAAQLRDHLFGRPSPEARQLRQCPRVARLDGLSHLAHRQHQTPQTFQNADPLNAHVPDEEPLLALRQESHEARHHLAVGRIAVEVFERVQSDRAAEMRPEVVGRHRGDHDFVGDGSRRDDRAAVGHPFEFSRDACDHRIITGVPCRYAWQRAAARASATSGGSGGSFRRKTLWIARCIWSFDAWPPPTRAFLIFVAA